MRHYWTSPRFRVAMFALVAGATLFGWAMIDAVRLTPLPAAESANVQLAGGAISRPNDADDDLLDEAVANDPFQPNRQAPATRYGAAPIPVTVQDAAGPGARRASLRLLGTVVDRDGASFALCQLEDATIKMVHAGQKIGTYRLRSITPGGAMFDGDDGAHLALRVSRAGN